MKTPVTLLMAVSLLLSSCIVRVDGKDRKFRISKDNCSFVQTYPVNQPVDLKITTSGGTIKTFGYEGNVVEVSFIVTKYGKVVEVTMDELKEFADVEIIQDSSSLEINIGEISVRNVSVGFEIKTPVQTTANLNTSGGNIRMESLKGNQEMNTSGGNMDIKDITGNVTANTSGGNIQLDHSTGKFQITTSGGNIDVNNVQTELTAITSGGTISLFRVQGKTEVSTSGGSIHLDQLSGSISANTSGGNITANINQLSENLNLETSGGNIDCKLPKGLGLDLDLSAEDIDTPLANFSGKAKKDRIQGKINGGGLPVVLKTMGGFIQLEYQ